MSEFSDYEAAIVDLPQVELKNSGEQKNQGARKDGRGNEPLPLRNVRCAETPEDS